MYHSSKESTYVKTHYFIILFECDNCFLMICGEPLITKQIGGMKERERKKMTVGTHILVAQGICCHAISNFFVMDTYKIKFYILNHMIFHSSKEDFHIL